MWRYPLCGSATGFGATLVTAWHGGPREVDAQRRVPRRCPSEGSATRRGATLRDLRRNARARTVLPLHPVRSVLHGGCCLSLSSLLNPHQIRPDLKQLLEEIVSISFPRVFSSSPLNFIHRSCQICCIFAMVGETLVHA